MAKRLLLVTLPDGESVVDVAEEATVFADLGAEAGRRPAIIGVTVAVALLPPAVTAGLLAGAGHWEPARGALLLALANAIGINLAAIVTLLLTGVRPAGFFEAEAAKRSTWIAIALWGGLLLALVATVRLAGGGG